MQLPEEHHSKQERVQEAEAQQRRAAGELLLRVPMDSELGSVTPVFVVPGEWAPESVAKVAQLIAFNMRDNAGCNCLSPRALVLSATWPQVRSTLVRVRMVHRSTGCDTCELSWM